MCVCLACVRVPSVCVRVRLAHTMAWEITERPRAPSGVAVFMSVHSKTPCITPSTDFFSGNGVVRGRQQLAFTLDGLLNARDTI